MQVRTKGARDGNRRLAQAAGSPVTGYLHPTTNLLERSLGEVKRRTKVIGRFPGETSCPSLCWAGLGLVIAGARGLALTDFEHLQLADVRAAKRAQSSVEMTALNADAARRNGFAFTAVAGRDPRCKQ